VSRKLLISDANILIDMTAGGVLREIFSLDYEFAVPDVLYHEELSEQHPELPGLGLSILELGEAAIIDTAELGVKHARTGISNNDCLALALARQEACPLLTGDNALRQVSILEEVEVRGTIWLIGELLDAGVIDVDRAEAADDAMRADGSRLPWNEVEAQLRSYRNR
jgi:predicted nucleic acid-binding protein